MAADALGRELLALARAAIAERFGERFDAPPPALSADPALRQPGATFVTLTEGGALRGCIGSLEAHRPLAEDVCENARAAAFGDPRFAPLTADELPRIRVEVSLLTPPTPIACSDEENLLAQLVPGKDGLILSFGPRRATFLPQVWEQLPEPRRFLAHLKQKAGLPADFWDGALAFARYGVEKWKEAAR